jgi:hypothetical protein
LYPYALPPQPLASSQQMQFTCSTCPFPPPASCRLIEATSPCTAYFLPERERAGEREGKGERGVGGAGEREKWGEHTCALMMDCLNARSHAYAYAHVYVYACMRIYACTLASMMPRARALSLTLYYSLCPTAHNQSRRYEHMHILDAYA